MERIEMEIDEEKAVTSDSKIMEIPDNVLIEESEAWTDMQGFDNYLRMLFGEKEATVETQTERVTKRHMKLQVFPDKLGIYRDKETFIDPRMFQGDGPKQYKLGGDDEDLARLADNVSDVSLDESPDKSSNDGYDNSDENEEDELINFKDLLNHDFEFEINGRRRCNSFDGLMKGRTNMFQLPGDDFEWLAINFRTSRKEDGEDQEKAKPKRAKSYDLILRGGDKQKEKTGVD